MELNETYTERFLLAVKRLNDIVEENHDTPLGTYFTTVSRFLLDVAVLYQDSIKGTTADYTLEEWQVLNHTLYQDILGENYEKSYANPDYACRMLGDEFGLLLCTLYTELRGNIAYATEGRLFYLVTSFELFIEVYNLLENPDCTAKEIRSAIYYYFFDYCDVTVEDNFLDCFDPSHDFAVNIICNSDLSDLRYLYRFGEYISDNELETARYLNSLPKERLQEMARTFTEGFRRGFENYNIDMSRKKTVNIRYHIGFEAIVREVIAQFDKMGLKPCIYRASVTMARRTARGKVGYFGATPNKQYDYDHRTDDAVFFNKAYAERRLSAQKQAFINHTTLAADFAGPTRIETFGEAPFAPVEKKTAARYTQKQQKCKVEFQSANALLTNTYIPGDETSFCIISYPLPEIGKDYKEIFDETVRVNTLDTSLYLTIQSKIIDALDQGEFVTITGRNGNRTNLTVGLTPITDPSSQTKFENCLADVNIPLGEVFTSPALEGTNGILHVTDSYLNDLEYKDLTLTFENGIVSDYNCSNFDSDEDNKKYIKDNLLFQHDTLPMGEFAVGTNTTAYTMAKRYQISHLLPILIKEKTGPHFAIGDTCFSHEEDMKTYNPDGKQMMAKENRYTLLRHANDSKNAYFNCHTDITIPYDELDDLLVHTKEGQVIPIIRQGRFVLPGTEVLNEAL